jgi:hypothetical protein
MDKWLQDLKGLRSLLLIIPVLYYILLLWSLLAADSEPPRTVYYYNELAFVPLLVLCTVLFFQREFGGGFSEIYATFPLSFAAMICRKLSLMLSLSLLMHGGWVLVYLSKFGVMKTDVYSYSGAEKAGESASWLDLLVQAFPSYLLVIAVVILVMILTKKIYTGIAAGFFLWLVEAMSGGKLLGEIAFFTRDIPPNITFMHNRLLITGIALACTLAAIGYANRRHHWIMAEEGE